METEKLYHKADVVFNGTVTKTRYADRHKTSSEFIVEDILKTASDNQTPLLQIGHKITITQKLTSCTAFFGLGKHKIYASYAKNSDGTPYLTIDPCSGSRFLLEK